MTDSVQKNTNYGGVGFLGLLTILFIALKLTGVIFWSWWWVLSPLWIPWVIVVPILLIAFIFVSIPKKRKY